VSFWVYSLREPFIASGDALLVLQNFGTNAMPILSKAIEQQDGPARKFYQRMWPKAPEWVQRRLPRPVYAEAVRQNAVLMLYMMGTNARPAIPALIAVLNDRNPEIRRLSTDALGHIHQEPAVAVPAIMRLVSDADNNVRESAVFALGMFDGEAKVAVPNLLELLSNRNPEMRMLAADALDRIDHEALKTWAIKEGKLNLVSLREKYRGKIKLGTNANTWGSVTSNCVEAMEAMLHEWDTIGASIEDIVFVIGVPAQGSGSKMVICRLSDKCFYDFHLENGKVTKLERVFLK